MPITGRDVPSLLIRGSVRTDDYESRLISHARTARARERSPHHELSGTPVLF